MVRRWQVWPVVAFGLALGASALAAGTEPGMEELARGATSGGWPFAVASATDELWFEAELAADVDWADADRACALLELLVDGLSVGHVVVTNPGPAARRHRAMLGRLAAGRHELRLRYDAERSPRGSGTVRMGAVRQGAARAGEPLHRVLTHAPVIRAPVSALQSDLPVFLYASEGRDAIGAWLDYTVIYTNEDSRNDPRGLGNLFSRWGRASDIESIYRVWVDAEGRVLATWYQAEDHEDATFAGVYSPGRHPELWVTTENGMVGDAAPGPDTIRLALMPAAEGMPSPADRPREWYMLAEPWLYELMVKELRRELYADGSPKIESPSLPETIDPGDPTDFLYVALELSEFRDAHPAVGLRLADGREFWNDHGQMDVDTLDRNGWQQVAIELPAGLAAGELAGELCVISRDGALRLLRVGPAFLLDKATLRPVLLDGGAPVDLRLAPGGVWTRPLRGAGG